MAIKITPEEILDLAGKLESNASEMSTLAGTVNNNFANGTANFEGNTANRYQAAFTEMLPTLRDKMPQLLTDLASELRKTADAFSTLDG